MEKTGKTIWLKDPLAIFTGTEEVATGGIVIRDNLITEILARGQTPQAQIDSIVDCSKHILIPGLINTHHHCYQTLTRALPQALNKELFPWLQALYPVWAKLDEDMLRAATQAAAAELLLSGCTTLADHHYLFPQGLEYAIDCQVDALRPLGMRATLTRGSMSLGQDQGGLPPQQVVQDEAEIISDSERLISHHHDASEASLVQIALAPCSPFSVSPALMSESARLADIHQVRLHTHLAETHDEEAFCLKTFGLRPVDYLESVGWLKSSTWLAHGIHFDHAEILRLGANQVGIAHCPSSNMMLASGICPVLELEAAGSPVGLAVDGSASNDASNMIQEVRQAMYLQRLNSGSSKVSHLDALRWATAGSAKVLGRPELGELSIGKQADIAFFTLNELRFAGSHDPLAALLLCGAHRADRVMVGGQWRVYDAHLVDMDQHQLADTLNHQARRLVSC